MQNYIQEALRTAAGGTPHTDKVPAFVLLELLLARVDTNTDIDAAKKSLFYGKAPTLNMESIRSSGPYQDTENASYAPVDFNVLHGVVGIDTEAAELVELLATAIQTGEPIDSGRVVDESGDLLWYLAILFDAVGINFEEVMEKNIQKLRVRYPEKFSEHLALNRNEAQETAHFH
ncbi:MazG nucleotide pyrophosphohydrolase domain-containing protein [Terrihabitans soli]|nr:MazG nucleotide pyrophosphohydrolase domain-containing protein [Terrihabitans soli]